MVTRTHGKTTKRFYPMWVGDTEPLISKNSVAPLWLDTGGPVPILKTVNKALTAWIPVDTSIPTPPTIP